MNDHITFAEWLAIHGVSVNAASQIARVSWRVANNAKRGVRISPASAASLADITGGEVSWSSMADPAIDREAA